MTTRETTVVITERRWEHPPASIHMHVGGGVYRETVSSTVNVTVTWATCRLVAPYPPDRMPSRLSHLRSSETDSPPPACTNTLGMAATIDAGSTPLRRCLPPPSCNAGIAPPCYAVRRRSRLPRRRTRDLPGAEAGWRYALPPPYYSST